MKVKIWALVLIVICTLFTSTAQVFYKFASVDVAFDVLVLITNWNLIIGTVLYGFGGIILIIALRGGPVSVLYPVVSTSFIWVILSSHYIFNESLNFYKIGGVVFIILGIIAINFGGDDDN